MNWFKLDYWVIGRWSLGLDGLFLAVQLRVFMRAWFGSF